MRILAIEQAAVFDAVNGIERSFTHIYVKPNGPHAASSRAAAIQAAYTTLIRFFPSQKTTLDAQREASLGALVGEEQQQINLGVKWGQKVAEEILALRCGDGFRCGLSTLHRRNRAGPVAANSAGQSARANPGARRDDSVPDDFAQPVPPSRAARLDQRPVRD
jgi:hypothetical protein